MAAGVRILCLNGGGKGLYHLQRHFFILFLVFADFALLAFQFYILDIFDGSYNIDKSRINMPAPTNSPDINVTKYAEVASTAIHRIAVSRPTSKSQSALFFRCVYIGKGVQILW